jgi:N-acetylmuramic acid 6-phosphate (MurNAc-6-P) etherase
MHERIGDGALARIAVTGTIAHGIAAALRYGLIGRDDLGIACESGASGLRYIYIDIGRAEGPELLTGGLREAVRLNACCKYNGR